MLAKKYKLSLKQHSFQSLAQSGWGWQGVGLRAVYDFQGKGAQAAVVIPKSVVSSAAARTSWRRLIFDQLSGILSHTPSLRLIIQVTHNDGQTVDKQLQALFTDIEHRAAGIDTKYG
ncbi:MAG: hypothetical protein UY47_C0003G0022 [Parcubacteria group bacterium GW2011_GWB1_49_7]|nr:MAG: hypothetical protein UX28_C0001G0004 [Candidatus Pacebacteria bacterium GW2011_GWA1_46_10]KKW09934.1 MAG: hypothetical protein UY47_C0003G0022 [Parcubacteria group bacterium GW2011_GWB1_49_7]HCR80936.1 hypothetical protein [Candidatus Paceibacterota bacterium]